MKNPYYLKIFYLDNKIIFFVNIILSNLLHLFLCSLFASVSPIVAINEFQNSIIEKYLQHICDKSSSSNDQLILLQQRQPQQQQQQQQPLQEDKKQPQNPDYLLKYLGEIKCNFDVFSQDYLHIYNNNKTTPFDINVMERLIRKPMERISFYVKQNRHIQLLFDFSQLPDQKLLPKAYEQLSFVLMFADHFYWRCNACRRQPICFWNFFENSPTFDQNLIKLSNQILLKMKRDFRAILVPNMRFNYTVHLNPIRRCRFLHQSFVAKSFSDHMDFAEDRAGAKNGCDLEWSSINVYYNNISPFCEFVPKNGKLISNFAIENEFLKMAQRKFRFRSYLQNGNQVWGHRVTKFVWTGLIGLVLNRTADFAICEISQTFERSKVIQFTELIWVNDLAFMSQAPEGILPFPYWTVLKVFTVPTWFAILVSFALIYIALAILVFLGRQIDTFRGFVTPLTNRQVNFRLMILEIIAILLEQSIKMQYLERIPRKRLIYGVWMFAALILSTAYCGHFFALFSLSEPNRGIDTIEDLAAAAEETSKPYIIVTSDQSSFLSTFKSATPEDGIFYSIGKNLNRSAEKLPRWEEDFIPLVEKKNSRYIAIGGRVSLRIFRQRFANDPATINIGSEQLKSDFIAIAIPPKSPLASSLNQLIVRLREVALFQRWLAQILARISFPSSYKRKKSQNSDAADKRRQDTKTDLPIRPLSISDFRSLFVMWTIGLISAFVSFILEYLQQFSSTYSFSKSLPFCR